MQLIKPLYLSDKSCKSHVTFVSHICSDFHHIKSIQACFFVDITWAMFLKMQLVYCILLCLCK